MTPALEISRSTLMHTSLAYLSDELRTMDSIISSHNACSLPLELLYIIRAQLLIQLTDHLIFRSSSALQRYEASLQYMLCPECIAYNQDVYGNDIWGWEQFLGACACFTAKNPSISSPIVLRRMDPHLSSYSILSPSTLNPKKFTNRHHWLEFYLSMKARRLIRRRTLEGTVIGDYERVIWDLVSNVLEGYGCQSIRAHRAGAARSFALSSEGHPSCLVVPVPQEHFMSVAKEDCTTLKRVERDLALSVEYNVPQTSDLISKLSRTGRFSLGLATTSDRRSSVMPNSKLALLKVANSLQIIFLTALSIPLSVLTLALTILCFYSRPWAFRIL